MLAVKRRLTARGRRDSFSFVSVSCVGLSCGVHGAHAVASSAGVTVLTSAQGGGVEIHIRTASGDFAASSSVATASGTRPRITQKRYTQPAEKRLSTTVELPIGYRLPLLTR